MGGCSITKYSSSHSFNPLMSSKSELNLSAKKVFFFPEGVSFFLKVPFAVWFSASPFLLKHVLLVCCVMCILLLLSVAVLTLINAAPPRGSTGVSQFHFQINHLKTMKETILFFSASRDAKQCVGHIWPNPR